MQPHKLQSLDPCCKCHHHYYYYYYYYYEKTINDLIIVYFFLLYYLKCTYQVYKKGANSIAILKVGNSSITPCPVCILYNSLENELIKRLQ